MFYRARCAREESIALFSDLQAPPTLSNRVTLATAGPSAPRPRPITCTTLPAAFVAGIGDVGGLDRYPRAPAP